MKWWDMRAGIGVFGMCCVNTMHVWRKATNSDMARGMFFIKLAEALIDNPFVLPNTAV